MAVLQWLGTFFGLGIVLLGTVGVLCMMMSGEKYAPPLIIIICFLLSGLAASGVI